MWRTYCTYNLRAELNDHGAEPGIALFAQRLIPMLCETMNMTDIPDTLKCPEHHGYGEHSGRLECPEHHRNHGSILFAAMLTVSRKNAHF
jgi:hypothetical protein